MGMHRVEPPIVKPLTCVDCGAGGSLSYDRYEMSGSGFVGKYRCPECTHKHADTLNDLEKSGLLDAVEKLSEGLQAIKIQIQRFGL